ncbi:unnamed protein product [Haemonchus placei]|uniref:Peptidase_M13 domain-containing protein n=1 Tax=Haemonchus placei TaxID=6290 RepID=A0A0N4W215_HAEPC|nr:unnamed protein product [Haemonchus placei]
MLKQIAYPDFILDSKKLDAYYKGLSVDETDSYSEIIEKLSQWKIEFEFKRLIKLVDRNEYDFLNPSDVNAYYWHEANAIRQQFDAAGSLRDWWDAEVKKKFVERAQCMIDQYGKIEVAGTGLNINGKLTLGENIADNGGIKQALKAYRKYLNKQGEEKRIEGLEQYSNEQMFFIGYASIWCGHYTKDALVGSILTDTHPPNKYRYVS